MKDGGLRLFVVGYESGNEQILKNIKKGVSIERARRFTKDCHDLGILIHGTFIVGLPGETRETIEETIRFAREMNPETLQVSLASPYPGTHFYQYVQDNGFLVESVYNDEAGYQKCTVSYPGARARGDLRRGRALLPAATTSGRRYVFKSVKKMVRSREERKRLLREAGEFLSTMRKRRATANTVLSANTRRWRSAGGLRIRLGADAIQTRLRGAA